jgi:alkaline phosphatase D
LRQFLASRKNMVVLHGDRHWQYFSIDDKTGLREYSCGAASDEHAGGWKKDEFLPEHRYMQVVGGFLLVQVERRDGEPVMTLQHRDVDGLILNEDVFQGK